MHALDLGFAAQLRTESIADRMVRNSHHLRKKMQYDKKNNIFKRLAQSSRAKDFPGMPSSSSHLVPTSLFLDAIYGRGPNRARAGLPGTLERFADDLKMPPELLIDQFQRAGITGLTPHDKVDKAAKDTLLAYLRAIHISSASTKILYQQDAIKTFQIEIVQDTNEELIAQLASQPDLMYGLNPRKFEEIVARLFEKRGFKVTLTPASKDGGFDFFAELRNPITSLLVVAECKRYSRERKVGIEVVRGLHSVLETNKANKALVITSSFFTAGAIGYQRILGAKMGLNDYNDLVAWLQTSVRPSGYEAR